LKAATEIVLSALQVTQCASESRWSTYVIDNILQCKSSKIITATQIQQILYDRHIEYGEDVSDIFASHGLRHNLFADDMQGYCSGRSGDVHVMA